MRPLISRMIEKIQCIIYAAETTIGLLPEAVKGSAAFETCKQTARIADTNICVAYIISIIYKHAFSIINIPLILRLNEVLHLLNKYVI